MKRYKVVFDENQLEGVFGISLVHDPAMQSHFVALKEQQPEKMQLSVIDEKEYILAGLVLEPNKDIYRFNDKTKEAYNITFDEDTVKELCYAFTKNAFNSNSTEEHDGSRFIEGISFVENWIVRDENKDTALTLGLNPKIGSWVTVAKCDNKEVYEKALNGEFRGFSVDAMIGLEEINLKSEINMSTIKEEFVKLKEDLFEKLKLSSDKKEVSEPVQEIEEVETKEVETKEEIVEEQKESLELSEIVSGVSDVIKVALESQSKDFELKLSEQKEVIEGLNKKIEELADKPAAKAIKSQPVQVKFEDMTNLEKMEYNKANKR